jgi:glycosyltransferase involved in cell wall biosynthesis
VHLARFDGCRGKFYLAQDFEPAFSPAGAVYGLIEQTYRLGFDGIANSPGVADAYAAYGNVVHCLYPAVDTSVFHPSPDHNDRPIRIVFYGRPSRQRNGFELGAAALTRIKSLYGSAVEIISVGEEFDETEHGLDGVLTNLGVLPGIEPVAELYRSCDIGLVFMFTKHPSYQPLEYMASGCATVTNVNEANEWLLRDRINAILAPPTVSGVADALAEMIEDSSLRSRVVEGGLATAGERDWEAELALAHRFITRGVSRDR